MQPVLVPTTDVNSDTGILTHWHVADGGAVATGDLLLEIETSKALIEVTSPGSGLVAHLAHEGDEQSLAEPVALLLADADELAAHRRRTAAAAAARPTDGTFASAKAVARAEELGVDLASMSQESLITVADVERAAAAVLDRPGASGVVGPGRTAPRDPLPALRPARPRVQRLLLVGGGMGAEIVLDMLDAHPHQEAVAILDDDPDKWGRSVAGVPVLGAVDRLSELVAAGGVDAAVISMSGAPTIRGRWRRMCTDAGLPLANVVHPTARVARTATLGAGNIIGAFCNVGAGTRLGDNNFLSAYTSFDHHNVIGSEVSTGPGCLTSGVVTIGDEVVLGTGVFVQPHLTLGDGVQVASGAVVLTSVPAHHAVKARVFTTTVVPIRR